MKQSSEQNNHKPKRPDDKLYAVYPDYWKKEWKDKPLLGYVKATDPFYAKRKAYDAKLLPVNFTFGPEVVEVKRNFRK